MYLFFRTPCRVYSHVNDPARQFGGWKLTNKSLRDLIMASIKDYEVACTLSGLEHPAVISSSERGNTFLIPEISLLLIVFFIGGCMTASSTSPSVRFDNDSLVDL